MKKLTIGTCSTCKKFKGCDIAKFVIPKQPDNENPKTADTFGCWEWQIEITKAILVQPGQRLYNHHHQQPEILQRLGLTNQNFFHDNIDDKYKGTVVDVVDIMTDDIYLIYVINAKLYAFINSKGVQRIQE